MDRDTYEAFVAAVRDGRKVAPHAFEEARYFEGCLPIEVMADRGLDVLAFGPMKPVGLVDPRTGGRAHAVVQLRAENRHRTAYNLVGFQTRLAYPEQQRIFRMIPGLAQAEFLRYGSIHRNSYVDAPRLLGPTLELRARPHIRLAGQITGVEGYIESTAMGLLAARFVAGELLGRTVVPPPPESAMGALYQHITRPRLANEPFAPMNINFGLLPPLKGKPNKHDRRRLYTERAHQAFARWCA
jgi:methylenetetrahydrofolate--tRNA-(uracil-5-)-methyltransferase